MERAKPVGCSTFRVEDQPRASEALAGEALAGSATAEFSAALEPGPAFVCAD
jgi:hypothetical protein